MQVPQLYANFKSKSADGLSMAFLVVWLLGDVANLIGTFSLSTIEWSRKDVGMLTQSWD